MGWVFFFPENVLEQVRNHLAEDKMEYLIPYIQKHYKYEKWDHKRNAESELLYNLRVGKISSCKSSELQKKALVNDVELNL